MSRSYLIGLITCLISTLSVGPSMALVKLIEQDVPASQVLFIRGVLVVGVLGLILAIMGRMTPERLKTENPGFFIIKAVLWSIGSVAFYMAIQVADFAILNAVLMLDPLVTMTLARLFLGERISRFQQFGVAIAFTGILICVLPAIEITGSAIWVGIALSAVRMLTVATSGVMSRHLAKKETIEVYIILANLLSIPIALGGLLYEDWVILDSRSMLCLMGFSGIQILVTFLGAITMQRLPAAVSSSIWYLQLPAGTAVAWLVFAEIPGLWFYLGAVVLIMGLALSSGLWRPKRLHRGKPLLPQSPQTGR